MRVTAIESIKDGVMRLFGEGELIKGQVPNIEPFNTHGIENPCIKLDSGQYVWGFQCWWGETEKVNQKYEGRYTEKVVVSIPEGEQILPYEKNPE
jgi:hypothetical protein